MKRIITVILVLGLIICMCGCEDSKENLSSNLASEMQNSATGDSSSAVSSNGQKPKDDKNVSSKKEKPESKENHNNSSKEGANQETSSKNETEIVKSRLPEVKMSAKDGSVEFMDIATLSNGGLAVSGCRVEGDKSCSLIRIYDENINLKNEYLYNNGEGFNKIAVCSDGGILASSYYQPYITKINSNFETEWSKPYENDDFIGPVYDIEEISPDLIAVLFVSLSSNNLSIRRLRVSFLKKDGTLIETVDFMENVDPADPNIIADGNGGFYLLSACNQSLADSYPLVKENYDNSKEEEAVIMHFSAERELEWVKTLGSGGKDWIEESRIDDDGNIYLAMGTCCDSADSFWEMSFDKNSPYRRMLVKLDKNGGIVYKVPLSSKAMAVDQVFGIHIKDGKTYVVGISDYFDDYQSKYPCEQILPTEKGNRVFCVYNVCIDNSDGKELDRKVFSYDVLNNTSFFDTALLPNGYLVISGSATLYSNPFNLEFPQGVDRIASLYVFKDL